MKPPRSALKLPRYTVRKRLSNGKISYFFGPPQKYYDAGCTVEREPLGTDYDAAVRRAEDVLLPAFDSWLTGGLSDLTPKSGMTEGSFDWLIGKFRASRKFKEVGKHTQDGYEQGLQLVSDYVLTDGAKVGSKPVTDFTTNFVDAIYEKLLSVPVTDKDGAPVKDQDGKVVMRERRRMANGAMSSCRRAWNVAHRAEQNIIPKANPFSRMELKTTAPGKL